MNGSEMNLTMVAEPYTAGKWDTAGLAHPRSGEEYVRTRSCGILRQLGVPAHLAGYLYLAEAVVTAVCSGSEQRSTVQLYRAVARRYRTTPAAVERAIRHAIETGCCRCDADTFFYYFGNTVCPERGKPTNSELIARVADLVRQGVVS